MSEKGVEWTELVAALVGCDLVRGGQQLLHLVLRADDQLLIYTADKPDLSSAADVGLH